MSKYPYTDPTSFKDGEIEIEDKLYNFASEIHDVLNKTRSINGLWTPLVFTPSGKEIKFGYMDPRNSGEESFKYVISVTFINNKEGLLPTTPFKEI